MVYFKLNLVAGHLNIKTCQLLRSAEREKKVPTIKIGRVYFCWWSKQNWNSYLASKTMRSAMPQ